MELKEYFLIFKKHIYLFLITILLIVATTFAFVFWRPAQYETSMLINVSRIGSQQTQAYQFDEFYRLQADERFAETIVRWIASPRFQEDVCSELGKVPCFFDLKGKRLSSQVIEVSFKSFSKENSTPLAKIVFTKLNQETARLNEQQKSFTWFKLMDTEPVTRESNWGWKKLFFASSAVGIFLGFWVVLGRHYWEKKKNK